MNTELISIVIPVFNRAHLIEETLESIIAQTYVNWQCIVVDDGSTDNTIQILEKYHKRDPRIQYFKRNISKPKGANTCRNIGLENAKGNYLVFFDSDDLMTENHLEVKLSGIKEKNTDYVITRTQYFNYDNSQLDAYYKFDDYKITASNYITQKINWLTYDTLIKIELAKSIRFNEKLQSGQEYNYFCKLVLKSVDACFIDKVVTLRRKHDDSIRAKLKTKSDLQQSYFNTFWNTYLDIKNNADRKDKIHLLQSCIDCIYQERRQIAEKSNLFTNEVLKTLRFKSVYYLLLMISLRFGKGYYFRSKLLNK